MISKSILDLRFKGKIDSDLNPLFNQIALDLRCDFNELITEISKPNKNNIDWWVQDFCSRNTYSSPFFFYYCSIYLVNQLITDGKYKFEKILVDTKEIKKIIESVINQQDIYYCKIEIDTNKKKLLKRIIGNVHILFYNSLKWFISKLSKRGNTIKLNHDKSITLIDTFAIPGYTDSKRWYGSFWENLPGQEKTKTFFVPTLTKTSLTNLFSVYREIRLNKENNIVKEDYINFNDLFFAFNYKKRLHSLIIKDVKILEYSIKGLIEEFLLNPSDIYTLHESLLTYRFILRLSQKKIKVRLAIDWFEGQIIDKAWNAGFNNFYPKTKTISYRAIQNFPLYLCSYPIPIEKESGVISNVFAVSGSASENHVKEFIKDLKTIIIPSYKSDYVWGKKKNPNSKRKDVLVTLPLSFDASKAIISLIIDVISSQYLKNNSINFIIKPHPTRTESQIRNKLKIPFPSNIKFTNIKSFSDSINSSKLLITEASSTCLEAIAIGIPVIIIKRKDGLYYNPIPNDIDESLYRECTTTLELANSLNYYTQLNFDEIEKIEKNSLMVRKMYFKPVTQKGTNRLMDIKIG